MPWLICDTRATNNFLFSKTPTRLLGGHRTKRNHHWLGEFNEAQSLDRDCLGGRIADNSCDSAICTGPGDQYELSAELAVATSHFHPLIRLSPVRACKWLCFFCENRVGIV